MNSSTLKPVGAIHPLLDLQRINVAEHTLALYLEYFVSYDLEFTKEKLGTDVLDSLHVGEYEGFMFLMQ